MGRSAPVKDHFVVAGAATMVVRFRFLGFLSVNAVLQVIAQSLGAPLSHVPTITRRLNTGAFD